LKLNKLELNGPTVGISIDLVDGLIAGGDIRTSGKLFASNSIESTGPVLAAGFATRGPLEAASANILGNLKTKSLEVTDLLKLNKLELNGPTVGTSIDLVDGLIAGGDIRTSGKLFASNSIESTGPVLAAGFATRGPLEAASANISDVAKAKDFCLRDANGNLTGKCLSTTGAAASPVTAIRDAIEYVENWGSDAKSPQTVFATCSVGKKLMGGGCSFSGPNDAKRTTRQYNLVLHRNY
jgi:hypothetical protein